MNATNSSSVVMKYYQKFEPLATTYARNVYDSYKIAMDLEDLVQEFKLKIYTSIIAYAKKWQTYKETGRYRPVPIEIYVKSALNNKRKDLFKAINEAPFNISVEDTSFDFSEVHSMFCRLNPRECIAELNGIDLVEGLNPVESKCFIMFIYGFSVKKLQKVFKSQIEDVESLVQNRINELKNYYPILSENRITVYKTYSLEEQ